MSNEMINNKAIIANELAEEIKTLILNARKEISKEVNKTLVDTYWNVGRIIVEKEQ